MQFVFAYSSDSMLALPYLVHNVMLSLSRIFLLPAMSTSHIASQPRIIMVSGATMIEGGQEDNQRNGIPRVRENDFKRAWLQDLGCHIMV